MEEAVSLEPKVSGPKEEELNNDRKILVTST
jgi:hypothetical protein